MPLFVFFDGVGCRADGESAQNKGRDESSWAHL
jgi:hypothetical protein